MKQAKLTDDFGDVAQVAISTIPDIIKSVKVAYEGMLRQYGKDDCNVVYYGGKIVGSIEGCREPDNYADAEEHLTYCGEISSRIYDHIKKTFGNVSLEVEGHFLGDGAKHSPDQAGDHVWICLQDGTIIDGAFKQYQDPSLKRRKRLRIVKPTDPEYADYGFSASKLSSSYDEQLHNTRPKRIKIPIENARVSNKYWYLSIQNGKDALQGQHGEDLQLREDRIIDPVASHKKWEEKHKAEEVKKNEN